MTNASQDDPKRQHVPLVAQIEAAKKMLHAAYRSTSVRVRDGHLSQRVADLEIATLRGIRDTLLLIAEHEDEIRAVIRAKRQRQRDNDELEQAREHPVVKTVCEALDAEVRLPARADAPSAETETYPLNPETEEAA